MNKLITEIWKNLEQLCTSSGYVSIIVKLWGYSHVDRGELSDDDRLTVSEISILIGMLVKKDIDRTPQKSEIYDYYEKKTKCLLKELHHAIYKPEIIPTNDVSFTIGDFLKEAALYSKRSALNFQYLEFALQKYKNDENWLLENKGFTIENASTIVKSICNIMSKSNSPCFSLTELVNDTSLAENIVQSVISSFTIKAGIECNQQFKQIGDYNQADSYPIIHLERDHYLLLEPINLFKSIYQSPTVWMRNDSEYKDVADANRGGFVEALVTDELSPIFGQKNVYKNVKIKTSKRVVGEIDILVLYANRVLVVQTKSKSLTLNSRKGCIPSLQKDFQDSIQAAYDQGKLCAETLLDAKNYKLFNSNDTELHIKGNIQDVNIMCVVADDYSGLPVHVMHFLKYDDKYPPYVVDVFILDLIVTFLNKSLYFLDFLYKRIKYFKQIHSISASEFDILSYYLKYGFSEEKCDFLLLPDDPTGELDDMMIAKYQESSKTIEVIMSEVKFKGMRMRFLDTFLERTIDYINKAENNFALDFGFFLLNFDRSEIDLLVNNVLATMKMSLANKKNYILGLEFRGTGLTIFCNYNSLDKEYLYHYCNQAKYIYKLDKLFGCVFHHDLLKPVLKLDSPYFQSNEMDEQIQQVKLVNHSSINISK